MPIVNQFMMRAAMPRAASVAAGRLGSQIAAKAAANRAGVLAARHASTKANGKSDSFISRLLSNTSGSNASQAVIDNVYYKQAAAKGTVKSDVECLIGYQGLDEKRHELSHHPHSTWTDEELKAVRVEHVHPEKFVDKLAHMTVQTVRNLYDVVTGYKFGKRDERCYVRRIIFLETVAGVPGMVGAMVRHLNSLRRMKRDYGWIHTLLEEAENERMHLMCAMLLIDKPSFIIRYAVVGTQAAFMAFYTAAYLLSPRYCHRFVGYIEEEAVKTYTGMIEAMEAGKLPKLDIPAHETMKAYWQMAPNSSLKDVIYNIRADESHHREVNHAFAEMKSTDINPFHPGY